MKISPVITKLAFVLTLMLSVVLSGCVSTPMPDEKMAVAEAAVQRVNTRSTSENAPGELQIAIAKLASAKQALASKDYELAELLFEEASIDAQVAEFRAEAVRSKKSAKEIQDASEVLRKEIELN